MTDELAQLGQYPVMMLYWKADVDAYGRVEEGNTRRRRKKERKPAIALVKWPLHSRDL